MSESAVWRPVSVWSGREVRALREARRMSVREFAAHLGVSDRMVSKWEAGGSATRPRPVNQAALDTSLARADASAQARFQQLRSTDPARPTTMRPAGWVPPGGTCVLRHPGDGKLMTLVPAGTALLGPNNTPTWVGGFFIDVYPTTNGDYARFLAATGHRPPNYWPAGRAAGQHPVVGVSLADALAYAHWADKAVPTGEQWEKAARGTDGSLFPWGDDCSASRCNVRESRMRVSTVVTRYEPEASPYGAVDLCGNVWEWCASGDPDGPVQTWGGSFRSPAQAATPSSWRQQPATASRDDLSFRCALSLEDGLMMLSI